MEKESRVVVGGGGLGAGANGELLFNVCNFSFAR